MTELKLKRYVLIKGGMYRRMGPKQFTGLKSEATRYYEDEIAKFMDAGTVSMPEVDAPDYSANCPSAEKLDDLARRVADIEKSEAAAWGDAFRAPYKKQDIFQHPGTPLSAQESQKNSRTSWIMICIIFWALMIVLGAAGYVAHVQSTTGS